MGVKFDPLLGQLRTTDAGSGGSGTVTSVSVVSANGLAGTIANSTTTPAITLSTTITGVLKGDGTIISAATAGTDYTTPSSTETFTNKTYDTIGTGNVFTINGSSAISAVTGIGGTVVLSSSPTLTGTLNVPTIKGGVGSTSTLVLESTSGAGSGDSITLKTGSQIAALTLDTNQKATFGGHLVVEGVTSTGATGTGKFVFDTSPVLTTPNLGTPSAVVLTNATGTATSLTAGAATALQTGRTINGVTFDGTSNITVAAAAGTLTGGTLASGVTASSLTSVGTLANLTVTNPISGSVTGNAATVTTNANLTGDVTSSGNATTIKTSVGLSGSPTTTTQSPADNSTKVATTAYVDNAVLGQDFKQAVNVATTGVLATYVYNNGSSGVGATITAVATGIISFDGTALTAGMRVLVKNETSTNTPNNGIYTVTVAGAIGVALILTRATDFDQSTDIDAGDSVFVISGTTQSTTTWAYNGATAPTIGTTNITFAQTAGQGSFTAGNGITITGNSIAITSPVTVANGGTGTGTAGIGAFNNITGISAAGTTGTTSTNLVFSTSPTLITPALGTPSAIVLTNATGTASSLTAGTATAANGLNSATTTVAVNSATAPSSGQVLTATSSTAATWQPASGGGMTWNVVTSTTQTAAVNNGYFANNAGLVTVTLPTTAAVGATISVVAMGAGGWKLAQPASNNIQFGSTATTTGTGGSLASVAAGDTVTVVCRVANTSWTVVSSVGNLTVT